MLTAEHFGIQNDSHHLPVRTSMPDGQRQPMSPCCACLICSQLVHTKYVHASVSQHMPLSNNEAQQAATLLALAKAAIAAAALERLLSS
jgi:hypothetical protein